MMDRIKAWETIVQRLPEDETLEKAKETIETVMKREEIYCKAMKRASKMLYRLAGCPGGFCTVATTCYEPQEKEEICSRCWGTKLFSEELERENQ